MVGINNAKQDSVTYTNNTNTKQDSPGIPIPIPSNTDTNTNQYQYQYQAIPIPIPCNTNTNTNQDSAGSNNSVGCCDHRIWGKGQTTGPSSSLFFALYHDTRRTNLPKGLSGGGKEILQSLKVKVNKLGWFCSRIYVDKRQSNTNLLKQFRLPLPTPC